MFCLALSVSAPAETTAWQKNENVKRCQRMERAQCAYININVISMFCLALSFSAQAETTAWQKNENVKRCQRKERAECAANLLIEYLTV